MSKHTFIDHVLFAGAELQALETAFSRMGLTPEYGGEHGNGVTQNSLIGFDDGTYIELITTVDSDSTDDERIEFMERNAGPCGWAVEPEDMMAAIERASDHGVTTEEPFAMSRETPAGELAAWEIAALGDGIRGTKLPFFITDTQPRTNRVTPTESVAGTELTGIGLVVLAVEDLDESADLFNRAFDLPAPKRQSTPSLGAEMAYFPDMGCALASPDGDGEIAHRLETFGETPHVFLIGTDDMDESARRFDTVGTEEWFGRRVEWLDCPEFGGRIGLIE